MNSICGANCQECQLRTRCKGCRATNGHPFGGDCVLAKKFIGCDNPSEMVTKYKDEIINEINNLNIIGIPKIDNLYALCGIFVNLEYLLPNNNKIKLLKDENIYLGTQVKNEVNNKMIGFIVDEEYLLVSEYNLDGSDATIILYLKRK